MNQARVEDHGASMRWRLIASGAGVLTLLAIVIGWFEYSNRRSPAELRTRSPAVEAPSDQGAEANPTAAERPVEPAPAAATPARSAQSKDVRVVASAVPLAERFESLRRLAEQGDSMAALQLHVDLQNCANQPSRQQMLAGLLKADADETAGERDGRVLMANSILEQIESADRLCEGISAEQVQSRHRFLEQAARAGNTQAQLLYRSEGSPVLENEAAAILVSDELEDYKRKAAEFTLAAARKCDTRALYLLGGDYEHGRFFRRDVAQSLAMRYVLTRVGSVGTAGQAAIAQQESSVSEPDRGRAQVYAQNFYQQYCRGR